MATKKSTTLSRKATLRDVGLLAKVDPSLVSRVLNNDPNATASAATKTRILAAAKKLNYTTNFSARNLKMAKTLTIGLLLPDLTNPVNDLVAHGVQERAAELGYGVVIANHSNVLAYCVSTSGWRFKNFAARLLYCSVKINCQVIVQLY